MLPDIDGLEVLRRLRADQAGTPVPIISGLSDIGFKSEGLDIGADALGFWKALREVYGTTREQRCWVHKTAKVLNKLPKTAQPRACWLGNGNRLIWEALAGTFRSRM